MNGIPFWVRPWVAQYITYHVLYKTGGISIYMCTFGLCNTVEVRMLHRDVIPKGWVQDRSKMYFCPKSSTNTKFWYSWEAGGPKILFADSPDLSETEK